MSRLRRLATLICVCSTAIAVQSASANSAPCPPEMVHVGAYCIDRYEASMVDQDSAQPLSPYYPPERRWYAFVFDAWETQRLTVGDAAARQMPLPELSEFQKTQEPKPLARSTPGVVPQGYLSYYAAKRACERAGKRLCSEQEWEHACRGEADRSYPYGTSFRLGPCNVSRPHHPAAVLHGLSSSGHLDPRLNLLFIDGDEPVLRVTGASRECASKWGNDAVYDMVGNLDEWVEDEAGVFRGGFYARRTQKGCEARVGSHGPTYFDYSIGTRCCKDAAGVPSVPAN